jgi:hypothetical protein
VYGGPLFALAGELALRRGSYRDHQAWETAFLRAARRPSPGPGG